ncbi:polysaccharide deacetylase family protein [Winogradskyella sp.]|nr:polysaccharide deacetylase family protein [Winogradskyella sp.]
MFHSIGCENEDWYRNWLSVSIDHFETFCKYLIKHNYESVFLDEWYENELNPSSKKQIVLTFDDGYLDNWVYAYPILKKYNLKGTIFINPEFVQESEQIRSNLEDVWTNTLKKSELKPLGFVNWKELQKMEASGVMDIQSHSMSHNFYFHSDKIKDIYSGQSKYDWMAWLNKPNRKPYYTTENQEEYTPKGSPIFDFGRALSLRRYFPDKKFELCAIDMYSRAEYKENKAQLIKDLNIKLKEFPGFYESDENMEKRYRYEIFESKRILEEKLNKKINYLCWPGGGLNQLSVNLSIEAGYKASTGLTKYIVNKNLGDYKNIKRYAMNSFIETSTKNHYIKNSNYAVNLFKSHEGNKISKNLYRANKLYLIIKDKLFK